MALFSQFIRSEAGVEEKIIMASTAAIIDALWYCLVVLAMSQPLLRQKLAGYTLIQTLFGLLLIILAIKMMAS